MRRLAPLIRSDSHLCLTDWAICLRLSVCLSAESAALKKDVLELRDLLHQAPLAVLHTFPICPDTLHFSPYPYLQSCTPSPPYALSLGPYQPRPPSHQTFSPPCPPLPRQPLPPHAMQASAAPRVEEDLVHKLGTWTLPRCS